MNLQITFGTDGVRGNANEYPFTKAALLIFGQAIASWSTKRYSNKNPKCLIAHDTRISCVRIKENLISGLISKSVEVIDAYILPTPAVLQIISTNNEFDFGIVISASHNLYQDNGIKIFDAKSGKINLEDEQAITKNYTTLLNNYLESNININLDATESDSVEKFDQCLNKNNTEFNTFENLYENNIRRFFPHNFLKNKKIVLDCANGATYKIAPKIFQDLGAQVITLAVSPNGTNINENCGSIHVESLQAATVENNADFGFAFDGDGDRVMAVDSKGTIKDGDDFLAILLNHPKMQNTKYVVGTVMSNYGLEEHLLNKNKKLLRTKVGDKYVKNLLEEKKLLLGGEPSGHIIMIDYMNSGDGIFVALRFLETLILHNVNLESFKKYPQVMLNVPIAYKTPLSQQPFAQIISTQEKLLKNGRIVVRYSGTENVLRIMTEDQDEKNAQMIAKNLATTLQQAIIQNEK